MHCDLNHSTGTFAQCINLMWPFLTKLGQKNKIIVVTDYFTELIEVKALTFTTEFQVMTFLRVNILSKYDIYEILTTKMVISAPVCSFDFVLIILNLAQAEDSLVSYLGGIRLGPRRVNCSTLLCWCIWDSESSSRFSFLLRAMKVVTFLCRSVKYLYERELYLGWGVGCDPHGGE